MIDENMDDDESQIIGQMMAVIYDSEELCEVRLRFVEDYPRMLHPKTILSLVLSLIDVAGDRAGQCDCPACRRMKRFCTTTAPRLVKVLDAAEIGTLGDAKDAIGPCEGSA
jgi:hypothetical protein